MPSQGLRADRVWFMEMNTRLQVEHPATEAVTGQDLVEWQLRVAAGEKLPLAQDQITLSGHAIEARLYAENPETGFLPSIGTLTHFKLPCEDIRIDSAVEQGSEVTPYYDPMIAKLIVHAPNRATAASRLATACRAAEVWPVKTNAAFLANALAQQDFVAGDVDTGFIESHLETLIGVTSASPKVLEAAAAARLAAHNIPAALTGFRVNGPPRVEVRLQQGTETHTICLHPPLRVSKLSVSTHGDETIVFEAGRAFVFTEVTTDAGAHGSVSDGAVLSPMPGHILSVAVAEGDTVTKGAALLVMEAMKMEMTLTAPIDGTVAELAVKAGDRLAEGVVLLRVVAAE